MVSVNVDHQLENQLAKEPSAVICNEAGNPIGRFLSESTYQRLVYNWAAATITDEELDERRSESGGRELPEIWKELGA